MNKGDNVFVMNSNYIEEIKMMTNDIFTYTLADRL
jgi:hypothetical protein